MWNYNWLIDSTVRVPFGGDCHTDIKKKPFAKMHCSRLEYLSVRCCHRALYEVESVRLRVGQSQHPGAAPESNPLFDLCRVLSFFGLMQAWPEPSWHNQEGAINHGCPRLRWCSVSRNYLQIWDSAPYSIVMCPCFFLHLRRLEIVLTLRIYVSQHRRV